MKTIKVYTTLLAVVLLSAVLVGHAGRHPVLANVPMRVSVPAKAWEIPFNVANGKEADQDNFYDFGWQSFLALNWPASTSERGKPDESKEIGAVGPDGMLLTTVWQTYKDPSEVFLPGAAPPPDWNSPPAQLPTKCKIPRGALVLTMASMATSSMLSDLTQAGFPLSRAHKARGPLIDQNGHYVRYEVRFDRSEFRYIDLYKYYNAKMQEAALTSNPPSFKTPPFGNEAYVKELPAYAQEGAIELKASWRILDPAKDIVSRYFHQKAWLIDPDGSCHGP
jgi:hypothetical protein